MKSKIKFLLIISELLPLLALPLIWYTMTMPDPETYIPTNTTGFIAFSSYGYAYTLIYIACIALYIYALLKHNYLCTYVCNIILIITFSTFPILLGWHHAGIIILLQRYGIGYYISIIILLLNILFITLYKKSNNKLGSITKMNMQADMPEYDK